MHLLFISSNRIGDSLINLQVLNKYIRKNKKEIEITLVSGELPLPIYDDYSMITNRIILKKEKYNLHWWKLYKKLSPLKFDEIIDFRSLFNQLQTLVQLTQGAATDGLDSVGLRSRHARGRSSGRRFDHPKSPSSKSCSRAAMAVISELRMAEMLSPLWWR